MASRNEGSTLSPVTKQQKQRNGSSEQSERGQPGHECQSPIVIQLSTTNKVHLLFLLSKTIETGKAEVSVPPSNGRPRRHQTPTFVADFPGLEIRIKRADRFTLRCWSRINFGSPLPEKPGKNRHSDFTVTNRALLLKAIK
tara:strand:- start:78 stop:500 length:423 start_codon:yes stop_codon:yes gene_type:complete